MNGFYYLHTNGDLIWKRFRPESDSPFVSQVWELDDTDREYAWKIALEALALGARTERIKGLAEKWKLTFNDSLEMLVRCKPTELMKDGMSKFIPAIFQMEVDAYWDKVLIEGPNKCQ